MVQKIPTSPARKAPLLVVAAALVDCAGRVLLQRRPAHKQHGGLWEFPGGKVDGGEGPREALARELAEELGIALDAAAAKALSFAASADGGVLLLLFLCRRWQGEPRALEASELSWHSAAELAARLAEPGALPPLDVPLARRVREVLSGRI